MGWNPNRIEMGKMEQIGIKRGKFWRKIQKIEKKTQKIPNLINAQDLKIS